MKTLKKLQNQKPESDRTALRLRRGIHFKSALDENQNENLTRHENSFRNSHQILDFHGNQEESANNLAESRVFDLEHQIVNKDTVDLKAKRIQRKKKSVIL